MILTTPKISYSDRENLLTMSFKDLGKKKKPLKESIEKLLTQTEEGL